MTKYYSDQVAGMMSKPAELPIASDVYGKVRVSRIDYVQVGAGEAGDIAVLAKLPVGTVRILGNMSYFKCSAAGVSLGHLEYTGNDGIKVPEALGALDTDLGDVETMAGSNLGDGTRSDIWLSRDGIDIATDASAFADGLIIRGQIAYVVE